LWAGGPGLGLARPALFGGTELAVRVAQVDRLRVRSLLRLALGGLRGVALALPIGHPTHPRVHVLEEEVERNGQEHEDEERAHPRHRVVRRLDTTLEPGRHAGRLGGDCVDDRTAHHGHGTVASFRPSWAISSPLERASASASATVPRPPKRLSSTSPSGPSGTPPLGVVTGTYDSAHSKSSVGQISV